MNSAKIFIVVTFLFVFTFAITGQNKNIEKRIFIPSSEIFKQTDGLITLVVGAGINRNSDTIRIYNEDGSLWYEYSYLETHPLYYKNNSNKKYNPFGRIDYGVGLKLTASSENWYEVVINEDTQDKKFIAINDPFLKRERWQKYIQGSPYITINSKENPLRETADGQVMEVKISDNDKFRIKRIEGDWLLVIRISSQGDDIGGWIRWKKESNILIGVGINEWRIPNKSDK